MFLLLVLFALETLLLSILWIHALLTGHREVQAQIQTHLKASSLPMYLLENLDYCLLGKIWDRINANYGTSVTAQWVELYSSAGVLEGLRNGTVDMVYLTHSLE
jgi:hypothetical protein